MPIRGGGWKPPFHGILTVINEHEDELCLCIARLLKKTEYLLFKILSVRISVMRGISVPGNGWERPVFI